MGVGTKSWLGRLLVVSSDAFALEPGQSPRKRLYANGDSITRAFDTNVPFDNLNNSWANGHHGFRQWFGLPDVKAHNQRITVNFGKRGRKNWIAAKNGARVDDFAVQAAGAAGRNVTVTYLMLMLGGNDVCRDSPADLPSDAEFEANVQRPFQLYTSLP